MARSPLKRFASAGSDRSIPEKTLSCCSVRLTFAEDFRCWKASVCFPSRSARLAAFKLLAVVSCSADVTEESGA